MSFHTALDLSLSTIILALILVYATELMVALPWPASWLRRKPLSCAVCMVGWNAILYGVARHVFFESDPPLAPLVAAAGLALLLVTLRRWVATDASTWNPPG